MSETTKPTVRPIRFAADIAYVPLTRGYEAVIDADDAELVGRWNWIAHVKPCKRGEGVQVYAVRTEYGGEKRRYIRMHRLIAGTPEGMETDHRDGDGLNNRRGNLRTRRLRQGISCLAW